MASAPIGTSVVRSSDDTVLAKFLKSPNKDHIAPSGTAGMIGHTAACLFLMTLVRSTVADDLHAQQLQERQERENGELRTRVATLEALLQACRLMCASSKTLSEHRVGPTAMTDPRTAWHGPSRVRSGTRAELKAKTNAAAKRRTLLYHPPAGARRPRGRHLRSQGDATKGKAGARRRLLGNCEACKKAAPCYSAACKAGKMSTESPFAECAGAKGHCDECYPESACGARPPGATLPPTRAPTTRSPSALPEWATCTDSSADVVTAAAIQYGLIKKEEKISCSGVATKNACAILKAQELCPQTCDACPRLKAWSWCSKPKSETAEYCLASAPKCDSTLQCVRSLHFRRP